MPTAAALTQRTALFCEIEVKDDGGAEKGLFEGYLSVFGNVDSYKDVVEPGAFTKTINDARGRHGRYLFPILWQHDPKDPIGGIVSMAEQSKGLYIKGQLDLSTVHGQQAYSGLKMGYLDGLSFGYDTIKFKNQGDIRHLLEVRMWEGSIVTFPANSDTRVSDVKNACGSTDWPLGERGEAWSGSAAHHEIVTWATTDDGSMDVGKLKSVHFYVDDADPTKITSYKMPFCRIKSGSPVAMPRAIMTCGAVMHGSMGGGDFGDSEAGMKSRIATYYHKMASEFNDPSITPPWKSDESAEKEAPPSMSTTTTTDDTTTQEKKHYSPMPHSHGAPREFDDVLRDREPDDVLEDLYDLMGALMTSIMENVYSGAADDDCQAAIARSLQQFSDAVGDWLHDAWDAGLGDEHDDDDLDASASVSTSPSASGLHVSVSVSGSVSTSASPSPSPSTSVSSSGKSAPPSTSASRMSLAHFTVSTRALKSAMRCYVKEGRVLSSSSRTRMAAALDNIISAAKDLQDMIDDAVPDTNPGKNNPDPATNDGTPATKKPANQSTPGFGGSPASVDGGTQPADAQKKGEEPTPDDQKSEEPPQSTPSAEELAVEADIERLLAQMKQHMTRGD